MLFAHGLAGTCGTIKIVETTSAQLLRKAHATADGDELVAIGCDLADSGEAGGAESTESRRAR